MTYPAHCSQAFKNRKGWRQRWVLLGLNETDWTLTAGFTSYLISTSCGSVREAFGFNSHYNDLDFLVIPKKKNVTPPYFSQWENQNPQRTQRMDFTGRWIGAPSGSRRP